MVDPENYGFFRKMISILLLGEPAVDARQIETEIPIPIVEFRRSQLKFQLVKHEALSQGMHHPLTFTLRQKNIAT